MLSALRELSDSSLICPRDSPCSNGGGIFGNCPVVIGVVGQVDVKLVERVTSQKAELSKGESLSLFFLLWIDMSR